MVGEKWGNTPYEYKGRKQEEAGSHLRARNITGKEGGGAWLIVAYYSQSEESSGSVLCLLRQIESTCSVEITGGEMAYCRYTCFMISFFTG